MPTLGDVNDERVLTASWEELQKQGPGRDPVHDGEPRRARVLGLEGAWFCFQAETQRCIDT